jgi:hypothetical protein
MVLTAHQNGLEQKIVTEPLPLPSTSVSQSTVAGAQMQHRGDRLIIILLFIIR